MIIETDYLKAKQIVQEYEKQLNISVVSRRTVAIESTMFHLNTEENE